MRYLLFVLFAFPFMHASASVEVYSEAQVTGQAQTPTQKATQPSNFLFSGHLRYKKSGKVIQPFAAAYVTSDSKSEPATVFNDRFFALGLGAMASPFSWATLIGEYRWVESQFQERNGYGPHDGRLLAIVGKDWVSVPRGPGRAVMQLYGESVFSSRLKSNIFNTGYARVGYDFGRRFIAKPYLEIRGRRDALYWPGENTNEARIGMNFGSSVQSFNWNIFLYQADRRDLKSEESIQETAALLTIGGEVL